MVDEYTGEKILQMKELMDYVKNKDQESTGDFTTGLDSKAVSEAIAVRPAAKTWACGAQPRPAALHGAQPDVLYRGNQSITVTPPTRDMETASNAGRSATREAASS